MDELIAEYKSHNMMTNVILDNDVLTFKISLFEDEIKTFEIKKWYKEDACTVFETLRALIKIKIIAKNAEEKRRRGVVRLTLKRAEQTELYTLACEDLKIKITEDLLKEIKKMPLFTIKYAKNDAIGFANAIFWFQN